MSSVPGSIAVVICTRDRPDDLGRCLDSLTRQERMPDQVVVVLGSESSSLPGLCDRFTPLPIRTMMCAEHNISASRNAGLAASDTEFVAYIDDDAIAGADWLRGYLGAFERFPSAWALGGIVSDARANPAPIEFAYGLISTSGRQIPVRSGGGSPRPRGFLNTVKGCNFAIRRQEIIELGGFDEFFAFAFDESDLMLTIQEHGGEVAHFAGSRVEHAHTPGHYRRLGALDRDWRREYASQTMFMLKHTAPDRRLHGWAVILRRLGKLAALLAMGVIGRKRSISASTGVFRAVLTGLGDARRAFAVSGSADSEVSL